MNENALRKLWENDRPTYEALGHFVTEQITHEVLAQGIDCNIFFKIPPVPRTKATTSLIEKAFYRNKEYSNPYCEVTDKVGTRFVVLLTSDIEVVKTIVQNNEWWSASLDRDYDEERKKRPEVFTYASVHFVITTLKPCVHHGLNIPVGYKCEVQIRTLMQHAYSEISHDTIYKPQNKVSPQAIRACSKAMALIEAADDLFIKVYEEIDMANRPEKNMISFLSGVYHEFVGQASNASRLSSTVVYSLLGITSIEEVRPKLNAFLSGHLYLSKKIQEQSTVVQLYNEPAILLVLYLLGTCKHQVKESWPLTPRELEQLAHDIGINI